MPVKTELQRKIVSCIEESIDPNTQDFQWDRFFQKWFRDQGTALLFLFRRHLGVTNAQYVELFSLLSTHADLTNGGNSRGRQELLFHTTSQVRSLVVESVNSLLDVSKKERTARLYEFAALYADIFSSSVVVDMFYCSCATFLPPGVTLRLRDLVAEASYIHSAGESIFVRKVSKSRKQHLKENIKAYVGKLGKSELPIPFIVYSHEDFSDHDRSAGDSLRRGINYTKIYFEKANMAAFSLPQIVDELRSSFAGRLTIPEAGPYTEVHSFNSSQTIWLLTDRAISTGDARNWGRKRYYLCYAQKFKNENPFVFFDEDKPAWKSHTTLPHTLTGALLNIARFSHSGRNDLRVSRFELCDPFGGSGTTWLEYKRLGISSTIESSDISPLAPLLLQDNLRFFLQSADQLVGMQKLLEESTSDMDWLAEGEDGQAAQRQFDFGLRNDYFKAMEFLNKLKASQPDESQEYSFDATFVEDLAASSFLTRLTFYVLLRAQLRFQSGYRRGAIRFTTAFKKSLRALLDQTTHLLELRRSVEQSSRSNGELIEFQDTYSRAVLTPFMNQDLGVLQGELNEEFTVKDARKLEPNSLDVIICDPPYGFNTSEDQALLASLYSEFLDSAISALKNHGQLLICLPAESYTGRDLPYCTRSEVVVNQVLLKAEEQDRELYLPAKNLPDHLFSPPYYWEAERALRRIILHFYVH